MKPAGGGGQAACARCKSSVAVHAHVHSWVRDLVRSMPCRPLLVGHITVVRTLRARVLGCHTQPDRARLYRLHDEHPCDGVVCRNTAAHHSLRWMRTNEPWHADGILPYWPVDLSTRSPTRAFKTYCMQAARGGVQTHIQSTTSLSTGHQLQGAFCLFMRISSGRAHKQHLDAMARTTPTAPA